MKYALMALCLALVSLTACQKKEVTVMVHEPHAFETAEGMKVGAILSMFHNSSDKDDALVKVETPLTPRAEIHNMSEENGVMKMRQVDEMPIPASGMASLTADGYHVMLFDLAQPLKAGDEFDATFHFKNSAPVTTKIVVRSRQDLQDSMNGMDHSGHH